MPTAKPRKRAASAAAQPSAPAPKRAKRAVAPRAAVLKATWGQDAVVSLVERFVTGPYSDFSAK